MQDGLKWAMYLTLEIFPSNDRNYSKKFNILKVPCVFFVRIDLFFDGYDHKCTLNRKGYSVWFKGKSFGLRNIGEKQEIIKSVHSTCLLTNKLDKR